MAAGHALTTDYTMRKKGWLLVAEAARKIGVAPQTVYRWIDNPHKEVEGLRNGYRRYVRWSTVLSHLGAAACLVRDLTQADVWVETTDA